MKILVVEHDRKMGRILRRGLTEQGFKVDVGIDGKSGLELAASTDYDAIVLDVRMPGQSGLQVLNKLRKRSDVTPILLLSAYSSVEDRIRGLNLGADDYLGKPFDFDELLARITSIARRPRVPPLTLLKVGDLVLDPAHHHVRRGGRMIDLTLTEFSLLEYLIRHKGRLVTRGMLHDNIWPHGRRSNIVEVMVNSLRQKIEPGFDEKILHTIRGAGYMVGEAE